MSGISSTTKSLDIEVNPNGTTPRELPLDVKNGKNTLVLNNKRINKGKSLTRLVCFKDWSARAFAGSLAISKSLKQTLGKTNSFADYIGKLGNNVLLPVDSALSVSTYYYKIESSIGTDKRLTKIKEDFSKNKFSSKVPDTLSQLQKEKYSILSDIDRIEKDILVKSTELSKQQELLSKEQLEHDIASLNEALKNRKNELNHLNEYSLILDLKDSNKSKLLKNSLAFVNSCITFAVFVTASVSTLSGNLFVALPSSLLFLLKKDTLTYTNLIFNFSSLISKFFKKLKDFYFQKIQIKRSSVLLKNIESLKDSELISCSTLGTIALEKSDFDMLENHFGLPNSGPVHDAFYNIGRFFVTQEQIELISDFFKTVNSTDLSDLENTFITDLNNHLTNQISLYRETVNLVIASRLGEKPLSFDNFNVLSECVGITKDMQNILSGIGNRFMLPSEVDKVDNFLVEVKSKRNSINSAYHAKLDNIIDNLSRQISVYNSSVLSSNSNTRKILDMNDIYSAYSIMLKAKEENSFLLTQSWVNRFSKGKFYSANSAYTLKVCESLESSFSLSYSFKKEHFHVKNDQWGIIWKLFHPERTYDKHQLKKANHTFLLNLLSNIDLERLKFKKDGKQVSIKNLDIHDDAQTILEAYDYYRQTEHVYTYVDACIAGKLNDSRNSFIRKLQSHLKKPEESAKSSATNILLKNLSA